MFFLLDSRNNLAMELRELFRDIRHFSPDEFDYPDKIDRDALLLLDAMRDKEGERRPVWIRVNADFALTGHSKKSRHRCGDAFDIVIFDARTSRPLDVVEQFFMALRYTWGGIGFYPYWDEPGLHVDRRPWTVLGRRALWWRDKTSPYVFPDYWCLDRNGRNGTGEQRASRWIKALCMRAGVEPFGFHAMRRYVASVLADEHKVSAKRIQRILRHKNISTTERYIRLLNEGLKETFELLSKRSVPESGTRNKGNKNEELI